ncbi:unnamed protein product [Mycena citricolor]|uniref:Major facilitator superfamily (MFS) profile domain-containing protein n=1 Tax=Mycena citricolor TaxID=2018698 RepID=A0AAD2HE27_9AGAR|nr:unnamed protein product [Mycena citricolor]
MSEKHRCAIDLSHHLSDLARGLGSRVELGRPAQPGNINLDGGVPDVEYLPIESITVEYLKPAAFPLAPTDALPHASGMFGWLSNIFSGKASKTTEAPVGQFVIPRRLSPGDEGVYELSTALEYSSMKGIAVGTKLIEDWAQIVHKPASEDWTTLINVGSSAAWSSCLTILLNPGEFFLTDRFAYNGALILGRSRGFEAVAVSTDIDGLSAVDLEHVLANWDEKRGKRPRVIYTQGGIHNPLGLLISAQRKKDIYDVMVRYDLILVEDDPYYFQQAAAPYSRGKPIEKPTLSDEEWLDNLTPSFLRYDYQGRVIRLDTFSKSIGPGGRLGFYTGSPIFLDKLTSLHQTFISFPSGLSQAIYLGTVHQYGQQGFTRWIRGLTAQYELRRKWTIDALYDSLDIHTQGSYFIASAPSQGVMSEKSRKTTLLSFVPPDGGMFVWLNIHLHNHPRYDALSRNTSPSKAKEILSAELSSAILRGGVTMRAGELFAVADLEGHSGSGEESMFLRASFSSGPQEDIVKGMHIFARVLVQFFDIDLTAFMSALEHDDLGSGNLDDPRSQLDKTIDRIGMGRYQWALLFLCGFGWLADNMWLQAIAIVLPRVQAHYSVPDAYIGLTSSVMFAGMMLGAVGWGSCSDLWGRSVAFNGTLFFTAVFGIGAAFTTSYTGLAVVLFFLGSAIGGSMPTDGTIILEHMPQQKMHLVTSLSIFFSAGSVVAAAIALLVVPQNSCSVAASVCDPTLNNGWKYLLAAMGVLTLVMFIGRILLFRLHESPRYLVHAGRPSEALEALQMIALYNGSSNLAGDLKLENVEDLSVQSSDSAPTIRNGGYEPIPDDIDFAESGKDAEGNWIQRWISRVKLVLTPQWRRTSLLVWGAWCGMSLAYTMFNVFLPKLLETSKAQTIRGTLTDVLIYTIGGCPGAFASRRWSLAGSTLVTAGFCILFVFGQKLEIGILTQLSTIGVGLASTTMWAVLYGWTPEIFSVKGEGQFLPVHLEFIRHIQSEELLVASHLRSLECMSRFGTTYRVADLHGSGGITAPMLGGFLLLVSRAAPVYASMVVFVLAATCVLMLNEEEGESKRKTRQPQQSAFP